jgi:hypothetical protein
LVLSLNGDSREDKRKNKVNAEIRKKEDGKPFGKSAQYFARLSEKRFYPMVLSFLHIIQKSFKQS